MNGTDSPTKEPPNPPMNWQQDFIATNLLSLGYNAWVGYLNGERGAVICSTNTPTVGMAGEVFKVHYVPRSRLAAFLNAWLAAPDTVILRHHFMNAHILEAVDTYNPTTELVFLLESLNQVTFFYLKNLPITPHKCYEQICKHWEEFQPADDGCSDSSRQSYSLGNHNLYGF
ncbi:MAG: hypothetical protein P5702_21710 [Limnospira sp. PMC 1291.21]|uniref:Uncharacterized protein n=3 Tax=Limnospira TaxID=2596745 RepID=A0A9P1KKA9_9CYAN|nr:MULTISPECIES: hypothetical protein [Limnospira]EKD09082.1 hypothetical protein SPLC1_S204830 [Arthrospira platensis C1]MDC0837239.1 hypothetical protein [Limnoraphis robusta]MDY7051533.1 hypothetical protein [Limnospira fusiformis LS22]QJB24516.1 hypothetical protein HFV01_00330 [Limnospira fusiformis SAG 85.79]RAQ47254.1 hypothetical protein B9S53_04750 [Arthrospira sp. O9.13F]